MKKNKPVSDADPATFIEEVGLYFEGVGLSRIAGRILGHLLICDPPHQCAAALAQAVGGSKASISTNLRLLLHSGLVERSAVPGQRIAHFHIAPGAWSRHMRSKLSGTRDLRALAEHGLLLLGKKDPPRRRRLEEMRDLFRFLEKELPALLDRYDRLAGGK